MCEIFTRNFSSCIWQNFHDRHVPLGKQHFSRSGLICGLSTWLKSLGEISQKLYTQLPYVGFQKKKVNLPNYQNIKMVKRFSHELTRSTVIQYWIALSLKLILSWSSKHLQQGLHYQREFIKRNNNTKASKTSLSHKLQHFQTM